MCWNFSFLDVIWMLTNCRRCVRKWHCIWNAVPPEARSKTEQQMARPQCLNAKFLILVQFKMKKPSHQVLKCFDQSTYPFYYNSIFSLFHFLCRACYSVETGRCLDGGSWLQARPLKPIVCAQKVNMDDVFNVWVIQNIIQAWPC